MFRDPCERRLRHEHPGHDRGDGDAGVGPFYLRRASLDAARCRLVMSSGPIVAALTGVRPAASGTGWRNRMSIVGLIAMALAPSSCPCCRRVSATGYSARCRHHRRYALFQAANNRRNDECPATSGAYIRHAQPVAQSRAITGASVWRCVRARIGDDRHHTARPEAVAIGMRITFAVAAILIGVALAIAVGSRALERRTTNQSALTPIFLLDFLPSTRSADGVGHGGTTTSKRAAGRLSAQALSEKTRIDMTWRPATTTQMTVNRTTASAQRHLQRSA